MNPGHLNLERLFQPTPAFIFTPNPWFNFHFKYFVQHFNSTMSDHSINYSICHRRLDTVEVERTVVVREQ